MNSLKRPWTNLILAPIWFLINIVAASVYFGALGVNETDIPIKITEHTPLLILITQVFLLSTLLITTPKDGFNILKNGWQTDKTKLPKEVLGGVITGAIIATLYIYIFSPLQTYLQMNIGDYVPAGETMTALANRPFHFLSLMFFWHHLLKRACTETML